MNSFNNVYIAVRKYCKDDHFNPHEDCFAIIARTAGVPESSLEYFLNTLQNLHLISYSLKDNCIFLTPKGKQQEQLFDHKLFFS